MPSLLQTIAQKAKNMVRPVVPEPVRRFYLNRRSRHPRYHTGSPAKIFSAIYRDGIWGSRSDFYSGGGSHDPHVTDSYIEAIKTFAASLPAPPDMVDLGCGDFAIGSRLRPFCSNYTACDVVPDLIERNRKKFSALDVTFKLVDLVDDPLPPGDIACIRQVLQHLSNAQILKILPKLAQYQSVVITEHLPSEGVKTPNLDKGAGPDIRMSVGSAVILSDAPFNLKAESQRILCETDDGINTIQTTLYTRPYI